MNLKKEQLLKILDDYVEYEGIREKLSDVAIGLFIGFAEKRVWPNLSEQAQQAVNDWIEGGTVFLKGNGDPGQGPPDEDPDE